MLVKLACSMPGSAAAMLDCIGSWACSITVGREGHMNNVSWLHSNCAVLSTTRARVLLWHAATAAQSLTNATRIYETHQAYSMMYDLIAGASVLHQAQSLSSKRQSLDTSLRQGKHGRANIHCVLCIHSQLGLH